MIPQIKQVIQKLEQLPPGRLAEVVDFIDFIRQREQDSNLRQSYAKASEKSFAKVWDNEDDSVYDDL